MTGTMRAARMHDVGAPMTIETVPIPVPDSLDVLVRVHACNVVPNLGNVLKNWTSWFPHMPLPPLPATFGLDATGEIVEVGRAVTGVRVGQRVYLNPGRSCGSCRACRANDPIACTDFVLQGYFGYNENAHRSFARWPFGGLGEYMTAPAAACVTLPDTVGYREAARFGYLGTGYSALRKGACAPGKTLLVNGASGTLGLGVVLIALGLGATRILAVARDKPLLAEVEALAPRRIATFSTADGPVGPWAAARTDGEGVDLVVDCLGPGTPGRYVADAIGTLRRGGVAVNIGAVAELLPMNINHMMNSNQTFVGSVWFTTGEGQAMADMARVGTLDMSVFRQRSVPLDEVNTVLAGIENRHGGFSNFTVCP